MLTCAKNKNTPNDKIHSEVLLYYLEYHKVNKYNEQY